MIYGSDPGFVEFLDDGGSIARRVIELTDRDADMGAMYIRHVLWRLREEVGDGAATAAVLFGHLFDEGIRLVTAGADAMRLRVHLEDGLQVVLRELQSQAIPIAGQDELAAVAETICHDAELAGLLGEIFEIVGPHGHFETRKGMDRALRREYVEGSYWEGSLHSKHLLATSPGNRMNFENPAILLSNASITSPAELAHLYSLATAAGANHLIAVVKDISDELVGLVHSERIGPATQVVPVKLRTADVGQVRDHLRDLSSLVGGHPIVADAGEQIASATTESLGTSRRFWVDADHFGLTGGKGDPVARRAHIDAVKGEHTTADDADRRRQLLTRLGRLNSGTAVLHVGAPTELEITNRQASIDRTVRVLRGATSSGALPGGGTCHLQCRDALRTHAEDADEFEEQAAYRMLASAMEAPLRRLVRNAGIEPGEALGALKGQPAQAVFDLRTNQVEDACAVGVLDVAAVQYEAIAQVVRGVALLLTADVLVHHRNPQTSVNP